MLDSRHSFLSIKTKSLLVSACLIGSMQMLTACDSKPSPADNETAHIAKDTEASVQSEPSTSIVNDDKTGAPATVASTPDDQVVGPSGYQKLGFGQAVTPALLANLGLTRQGNDNEQCYYVSDPKQTYTDQTDGERPSVLYQVIDGKVALISIRDAKTPFYSGVQVGDSVESVMSAHDDSLTYAVDKYAVDGDYYNLIANVNFIIVNDENLEPLLKEENIRLNNESDTLPIQVEYHIKGGQKLSANTITETDWTVETKRALKGQVESIDIGIPEAIYLVEGCS